MSYPTEIKEVQKQDEGKAAKGLAVYLFSFAKTSCIV